MACFHRNEPARDEGYVTAVFAGLTFMLALIAIAGALLARQQLIGATADVRRLAERYDFEGRANAAALRLLKEDGSPTLRWSERSAYGDVTITAEPDGRKISATALVDPQNGDLIAALAGRADADSVEARAASLQPASDGAIHREALAALSEDARWRECAWSLVSPFSRLTAFNLTAAAEPAEDGADGHAGEVWRITVDSPDGAWLDREVRFTGSPSDPAAVVDQVFERTPGNARLTCLPDLLRAAGRPL
jgi:hypothetical protein